MDEDRLREVADELYGLRPDEFTGARTAAEKEARAAGDRELAAAVKALRRPAVAAWAVNLLGRRRAELLTQVVALGDSLRQAQAQLQGDELRELTRQRRRLVAAVTAQVREVAESEGQRLSDPAVRQVEETLQAAMADPTAAEAVLSGLLAQPLSSTGLESLTTAALAVPLGWRRPPHVPQPGPPTLTVVRDDGAELRRAEERAAEAADVLRRATRSQGALEKKRAKARGEAPAARGGARGAAPEGGGGRGGHGGGRRQARPRPGVARRCRGGGGGGALRGRGRGRRRRAAAPARRLEQRQPEAAPQVAPGLPGDTG